MRPSELKKNAFQTIKVIFFYIFTYIFHILEFPGISWNYIISRKLPGNDKDFPEFRKFPSKWKHWLDERDRMRPAVTPAALNQNTCQQGSTTVYLFFISMSIIVPQLATEILCFALSTRPSRSWPLERNVSAAMWSLGAKYQGSASSDWHLVLHSVIAGLCDLKCVDLMSVCLYHTYCADERGT